MGQLKRDCPHCHTTNTAFIAYGEFNHPGTQVFTVGLYCAGCYRGIIAEIQNTAGHTPCAYNGDIDSNVHHSVKNWYPQPEETIAPESLPANLKTFFLQAANNIKSNNYDASSMMSRKTLEIAIKIIAPELTGNLYNRIEKLAENNLITPDLKDWAHIIRDDGNTAAHEEEPMSSETATELLSFVEMFLMYTFTMPGLVATKRHDVDEEQA